MLASKFDISLETICVAKSKKKQEKKKNNNAVLVKSSKGFVIHNVECNELLYMDQQLQIEHMMSKSANYWWSAYEGKAFSSTNIVTRKMKRPDARQDSRGLLGRGSDAKTARNSKTFRMDGRTAQPTNEWRDRPTRQGVESRVRV